jgi:glycosyltransferase involved in cell wall biosynthesis
MRDSSLSREIPESVEIVRTRAWTPPALLGSLLGRRGDERSQARRSGRMQRLLRWISRWVLLPDPYIGWVPFAARAAASALKRSDVLLTTSSPDSTHLVGLLLAEKAGAWIADFRDPWVRRMSFAPATGWHRRAHGAMERAVVEKATRVVVTSEATRADFHRRYPHLPPGKIVCIPNGYDEEDFPEADPGPGAPFSLLHLGQLNPERGIGPLLDHLEAFLALRPQARSRTRVDLVGPRYVEDEREVHRRGLQDLVGFEETLPHLEAVRRLFRARLLVLMEQESEEGSLILPGKIFEYLRSGRPIFGLLPKGAASDLLDRLQAGEWALPSEPRAGAAILARRFDSYQLGKQEVREKIDPAVAQFERRQLATQLAGLLEEAAEERFAQPRNT